MSMIGDLWIRLGLKSADFNKGIDDAKKKTTAFGSAMKSIGGMISGVFAVSSLINFGKELLTISGQAEGVIKAFNKIGTASDLQNLRNATRGTVSDLELMKRAVSANNFDIPVQQLGKLFEFAAKRAQDTGQSVDYLVDSIVVGIGRKSPLILDNLGISAIQLKHKLGGVGMETASVAQLTKAVGDIAEESFKKSGRFADTLGTKIVSLNVKWENFKLSLSTNEGFAVFWKSEIDDFDKALTIFFSKNISKWEKFKSAIDIFGNETDFLYNKAKNAEYVDQFMKQKDTESTGFAIDTPKKVVTLSERIKKLNQIIAETRALMKPDGDATAMKGYYEDIQKAQEELDLLIKIQDGPLKKSYVEQLAAIKKVNDELEAQRILRQEFKGEKMTPITPIGTPTSLEGEMPTGATFLGNMDSSINLTKEKFDKFTDEFNADAQAFTDELNGIIQSGIISAIETLASGLTELAMGDLSGKEFGSQILAMVGNFMVQLGTAFIVFSKLFIAFQASIAKMDGVTALGIGIALVGAGAAIGSIAKKGMSSSGGGGGAVAASGYSNYSQSNAVAAITGNVVFELEGTKLRGALNNTDRRNQLIR